MTYDSIFCTMPDWWRLMIWDRIEKYGGEHTCCGLPEINCPVPSDPGLPVSLVNENIPIWGLIGSIVFFVVWDYIVKLSKN